MPKLLIRDERLETLRGVFSGPAKSRSAGASRLEAKLTKTRPFNFVFGVLLNAAARHARGGQLSEFENKLLKSMRYVADDDELAEYGLIFSDMKKNNPDSGKHIFPDAVFGLSDDEPYTQEDYERDAAKLTPEIQNAHNFNVIDFSKLEGGYADSDEFRRAMCEYGFGTTMFVSGNRAVTQARPKWVEIQLLSFHCIESSGDVVFGPKDEIYWIYSTGADKGERKTHRTSTFGSIEDGSWREFPSNTWLFTGDMEDTLNTHIKVWEEDDSGHGFEDDLADWLVDVGFELVKGADNMTKAPTPQTRSDRYAAMVGLVLVMTGSLISWFQNGDDLVAERNISWDRKSVDAFFTNHKLEQMFYFNGGGVGKHELYLKRVLWQPRIGKFKTARLSVGASINIVNVQWLSSSPLARSVPGAALVNFKNELVAIWAPINTNKMHLSRSSHGTSWSTPTEIPGHSCLSRPSACTLGDRLWVAYRDQSNKLRYLWTTNMQTWNMPNNDGAFIGATTARTPDTIPLVGFGNFLVAVHTGVDKKIYWSKSDSNGTNWSGWRDLNNADTNYGPTLCVHNGRLYCFHVGIDHTLYFTSADAGVSWRSGWIKTNERATSVVSAVSYNGKLLISFRFNEAAGRIAVVEISVEGDGKSGAWGVFDDRVVGEPTTAILNGQLHITWCDPDE